MQTVRNVLKALLVVCLCMVTPAGAELIQHLDASVPDSIVVDVDGTTVTQWKDLSGNNNHAIASAGTVTYPSTPFLGGSVGLDFGLERNSMELFSNDVSKQFLDQSAGTGGFTVAVVTYTTAITSNWHDLIGNTSGVANGWGFRYNDTGQYQCYLKAGAAQTGGNSPDNTIEAGDTTVWTHTYNAATGASELWTNQGDRLTGTQVAQDFSSGNPVTLGATTSGSRYFKGFVGEVQIYNTPLSQTELDQLRADLVYKWVTPVEVKRFPGGLAPLDGSDEIALEDVTLSWKPGLGSTNQDVYFGTNFEDVNTATPDNPLGVYQGRQPGNTSPLPTLEYGTTYYWRIDSISDAAYSSGVSSFTTVLYAYTMNSDYITASASSTAGALDPNVTVTGAGLDPNNEHGTGFNAMWISNPEEDPVWIQYDFDAAVRLNEILIWNHNSEIEDIMGWGIKDATIDYTTDGQSWQPLAEVVLEPAPGTAEYAANNSIPVDDLTVEGIRINALNNYSTILPNMYGLAEVQFLIVPLQADAPIPALGATGIALDSTLHWTAGRGAVSHALYVSDDASAVADETIAPIAVGLTDTTYDLTMPHINTVYYWKVNENTGTEVWPGFVWSFTTVDSMLFDGFETYNDFEPNEIWRNWVDGAGDKENNGSVVGKDPYEGDGDPYTFVDGNFSPEDEVVRSGQQSLPIWFDNTVAPVSKATRSFTEVPDVGATGMVLYYQFGTDSVGDELFVEINGVEVTSVAIPVTILPVWNEISIDLATTGIDDATQITSMAIGIRGANAKGVVYVDDIMLTN